MRGQSIDCVIVGADRVAANGDVANKIGTYGLAVLAKEHGIPFYVAAPISTTEIVIAYVGAGATKTLLVAAVIFFTSLFFAEVNVKFPLLMIFLLILVAFTFALFGFLIGLLSKNFEQMSIIPTIVITPMVFLGGSLYSLDMLPSFWQTVTYFNPVVYLVNGLRFSFYGVSDFNIWISISTMILFLIVCVTLVAAILKKGYNIKN